MHESCESVAQAKEILARHRALNLAYWEKNVLPRMEERRWPDQRHAAEGGEPERLIVVSKPSRNCLLCR
jgi:hypothetical protein